MHKRIYVLLISILISALGLIVLTSCTVSTRSSNSANLPYLNSLEYAHEEGKILVGYKRPDGNSTPRRDHRWRSPIDR